MKGKSRANECEKKEGSNWELAYKKNLVPVSHKMISLYR